MQNKIFHGYRPTGNDALKIAPIYLIAFCSYIWVSVDLSFNLMISAALGFLTVGIGIASIGMIVAVKKKSKRLHAVLSFLTLVLAVITSDKISEFKSVKSIAKVSILINKIESYYSEKGHYPNSLDEISGLKENDLVASMSFTREVTYRYYSYDETYSLVFPYPAWMIYNYNPGEKVWHLDD